MQLARQCLVELGGYLLVDATPVVLGEHLHNELVVRQSLVELRNYLLPDATEHLHTQLVKQ